VVAVQPAATWPAVATGSTAAGSPAFEVAIPSSASCDGDVALDLALSTDHGAFSLPLALALGRKPSADVPKTIASSTAVVSTLTFAGAGPVQDLEVHIPKLTHTWVGDLVVTLESPGGSTVTLMNSPGAGADGAPGDDFTDLVLADDAPTTIESIPATAPAGGYTGRYKPDQPLASLDGENRQGTWTLRVVDRYPASDSGTLRSWALRPSGCATPSNGAPVAAGDAYGVVAGTTLDGSSVLANDSDPDGAALTAVRRSGPSHGTLGLAAGGTFSYTPQPGFSGQDAFTYVAYDGTATSLPATVAITVTAASAQPSPSPPPPPPPPATVAPRAPAKLEVLRAGIRAGRLDVLAGITTRARGAVEVRYRSSGETTRFSTPIVDGRISIARSLPAAQRRKSTGIFTLTYDGSTTVQPDSVTLRAAPGKARLVLRAARIDGRGRLLASGSIDRRARGVVHVRLGYTAAGGSVELLSFSSKIARGAWSLTAPLPRAAAQAGGQLSIQFTGYEPLRIRGEQLAKAVEPAG
jgi:subtilisin-like proprotein convertase family protein